MSSTCSGAHLAESEGASEELVAAALLHDIGHYTGEFGDDYIEQGIDNHHDEAGGQVLERFFPPLVTDCVRLHVAAKRYLCAADPAYFGKLSDASVKTLALQGGADERRRGRRAPSAATPISSEAVPIKLNRVRLWDEAAKVAGPARCPPEPMKTTRRGASGRHSWGSKMRRA
jgi:[1-hydroxy-2-(trimethylamino)ethyl]phosphonate dioxygenase